MMVVASGQERGGPADLLSDLETEHIAVESEGAIEVGDLEVDVADAGLRRNDAHNM